MTVWAFRAVILPTRPSPDAEIEALLDGPGIETLSLRWVAEPP